MQWKLAYAPHSDAAGADLRRISEIEHSGFPCISASVPGNLELDLMKAGTLPDLFFSDNVYESQKLETLHVWYYAVLDIDNSGQYLHFEGIDTFSDIFVNGEFVGETDNMFLSYDLHPHWKQGQNEVIVHIRPAMLQERMFTPPAACFAQKYFLKSAQPKGVLSWFFPKKSLKQMIFSAISALLSQRPISASSLVCPSSPELQKSPSADWDFMSFPLTA